MVNDKTCIGILNNDLITRINPELYESVLEKRSCREIDFTGRPMREFVLSVLKKQALKRIWNTGLVWHQIIN